MIAGGCAVFPEAVHERRYYNPFPQLYRVAVLPFYNLSAEPTLNQDAVALAYYNEIQQIPGFEVMPVGVAKRLTEASGMEPQTAEDFQKLAQMLDVDVVLVGAVTDFSPYYPPRMGLKVNWYAADPSLRPVPPGYGLPFGTKDERCIPNSVRFNAEFARAREQLAAESQIEILPAESPMMMESESSAGDGHSNSAEPVDPGPAQLEEVAHLSEPLPLPAPSAGTASNMPAVVGTPPVMIGPDVQLQPQPVPLQAGPIITHVRVYNGHDECFTKRLADYYYFRNDQRDGGWQSYLQRMDDFIRFCCYLHITETLAERGGADETRVVLRHKKRRYDR